MLLWIPCFEETALKPAPSLHETSAWRGAFRKRNAVFCSLIREQLRKDCKIKGKEMDELAQNYFDQYADCLLWQTYAKMNNIVPINGRNMQVSGRNMPSNLKNKRENRNKKISY